MCSPLRRRHFSLGTLPFFFFHHNKTSNFLSVRVFAKISVSSRDKDNKGQLTQQLLPQDKQRTPLESLHPYYAFALIHLSRFNLSYLDNVEQLAWGLPSVVTAHPSSYLSGTPNPKFLDRLSFHFLQWGWRTCEIYSPSLIALNFGFRETTTHFWVRFILYLLNSAWEACLLWWHTRISQTALGNPAHSWLEGTERPWSQLFIVHRKPVSPGIFASWAHEGNWDSSSAVSLLSVSFYTHTNPENWKPLTPSVELLPFSWATHLIHSSGVSFWQSTRGIIGWMMDNVFHPPRSLGS